MKLKQMKKSKIIEENNEKHMQKSTHTHKYTDTFSLHYETRAYTRGHIKTSRNSTVVPRIMRVHITKIHITRIHTTRCKNCGSITR